MARKTQLVQEGFVKISSCPRAGCGKSACLVRLEGPKAFAPFLPTTQTDGPGDLHENVAVPGGAPHRCVRYAVGLSFRVRATIRSLPDFRKSGQARDEDYSCRFSPLSEPMPSEPSDTVSATDVAAGFAATVSSSLTVSRNDADGTKNKVPVSARLKSSSRS
jgi:hypothetical protein